MSAISLALVLALSQELDRSPAVDVPPSALHLSASSWTLPELQWEVLDPSRARSDSRATLTVLDDGSVRASGAQADRETWTVDLRAPLDGISALRIEALLDEELPGGGPGRGTDGAFKAACNRLPVPAE